MAPPFLRAAITAYHADAADFAKLDVEGAQYYLYFSENVRSTWQGARAVCQARGLDLASLPSQQLADALHAAVLDAMNGAFHW